MSTCIRLVALVAICGWGCAATTSAWAHGGTVFAVFECDGDDHEEGDEEGRAVLDCHEDEGEDSDESSRTVFECDGEDHDESDE